MKQLWEIGEFVRRVRMKMRYGELSRAPLRILRLRLRDLAAEFDWLSRSPDVWAATLPRHVRDREASLQALQDAMALREMLFDVLPDVQMASFRAFRQSGREPPHLIITGTLPREFPAVPRVASPVMRAKLCGFNFRLEEGVLGPLEMEDSSLQLMISA